MHQRPVPGSRPRYRGAFVLWLTLAALPVAGQMMGPLTGQSLFFNQASNPHGNSLAANAGLLYNSNVSYTANGTSATLALVGLSGNITHQGPRLDYHLTSDIAVVKYLNGAFPTEPSGYLDAGAELQIVPGFFSWIVQNTYSEVQINPYVPVTTNNIEHINNFSTGPRFTLRPTLRTSVTLEGTYSYVSGSAPAEFVNFDSQRYRGSLEAERAFSSTSSLYVLGSYEKVDFKDQVDNNNFSLGEAAAGYRLSDSRTALDISGGYSKIRVEDVLVPVHSIIGVVEERETQTFGGATWNFNLSRLITPSQRVALFGGQQYTDAATALRASFNQPGSGIAPTQLAAGGPFQYRTFGASWRFEALRTTLDVSVLASRSRFLVISPLTPDSNSKLANVALARQLGPVLTWDIGASYQRWNSIGAQVPINGQASWNMFTAFTNLQWRVGERLGLRFLYARTSQLGVGSNQVGIIASYDLISVARQASAELPQLLPTSPASLQSPQP